MHPLTAKCFVDQIHRKISDSPGVPMPTKAPETITLTADQVQELRVLCMEIDRIKQETNQRLDRIQDKIIRILPSERRPPVPKDWGKFLDQF